MIKSKAHIALQAIKWVINVAFNFWIVLCNKIIQKNYVHSTCKIFM